MRSTPLAPVIACVPTPAMSREDAQPAIDTPIPPSMALAAGRSWLAVHLPALPLETGARDVDDRRPWAVSVPGGGRPRLLDVSDAARTAGVYPGMSVSAAVALCPRMRVQPHDEQRESAALEGLAAWSARYTPFSSPLPPRSLLMEIGASLRLFGGLGPLLERVRRDLRALGYTAQLGVAPTATAAGMLARAGDCRPVISVAQLAGRLARTPLECMELSPQTMEELEGLGVRHFGDCARLPRDGLGRRFGPSLTQLIDRALGRRADLRRPWSPPTVFERRLDLPWERADRALLLRAAQRLLHELAGFLCARACGAGALELQIAHRRPPSTRLVLELVTPSRDPEHLESLVEERLRRLELREEALYLGLRVQHLVPLAPCNEDLFAQGRRENRAGVGEGHQLLERLRARLGRQAVCRLQAASDHRPERMIEMKKVSESLGSKPDGSNSAVIAVPGMPLWLLSEPRRLGQRGNVVLLDGRLHLERGPWRIESGWWDGADVARDYYVARSEHRARYWIFRELREPRRWFLHGVFA